jgi:hypothetical protein
VFRGFAAGRQQAQCLGMTNLTELPSVPPGHLVPFTDQLRLAVAAYLARFKGSSRLPHRVRLPAVPAPLSWWPISPPLIPAIAGTRTCPGSSAIMHRPGQATGPSNRRGWRQLTYYVGSLPAFQAVPYTASTRRPVVSWLPPSSRWTRPPRIT